MKDISIYVSYPVNSNYYDTTYLTMYKNKKEAIDFKNKDIDIYEFILVNNTINDIIKL